MRGSGITQTQAAAALHMSQSAFSRRSLGYVEFRASELEALAKLFGVDISELVGTPAAVSA
jgi:transcriptional regulator with XRE-family HTH domain